MIIRALEICISFCSAVSRHFQIDRFLVSDPRPAADVEAQRSVQKLIRKAFREAKVAKQKAREKAQVARAQAVKEQQAAVIICSQKVAVLQSSEPGPRGPLVDRPHLDSLKDN